MIKMKKENLTTKIIMSAVFVLFAIYAVLLIYPYFFALNASLMKNGRSFMDNTSKLFSAFYFSNYIKALQDLNLAENNFFMMTFNSIWYAAGSTIMGLIASTCTAYVVSKYNFFGKNFLYNLSIIIMIIPIFGSLPAQYKLFTAMNIVNSPLYLVTTFGGFGMAFIYIYAFCKSISWSYAEAAFIDGAGHFAVFRKIMVPMLLPSLSVLAIINFTAFWNDYLGPLIWLQDMPTLASGLWSYERKIQYTANQPIYFAGVMISLIPILAIFIAFQNTIMTKVYTGGLKG